MRRGLLVSLFVVLALGSARPSLAANCTQAEKDQRIAAATAYAKRIPAERKAYFKKHKSAAQRRAFVAKEKKKLAALRAAAACTVPPPPPPSPPPFTTSTLSIGPSVGATQAAILKRGFDIANAYFAKIGAPSTWRAVVYVEGTVAEMQKHDPNAALYMTDGGGAYASPNAAFIVPAGASYNSSPDVRRTMVVVHEMFHTVQYALAPTFPRAASPDAIATGGPVWLREGAAEYVAYRALVDAGVDATTVRRDVIWDVTHDHASVPLETTATENGRSRSGSAAYNEGMLAVERLVQAHGIHSLIDFWGSVGSGTDWAAAFRNVFGMTVEQFYADFAAYRKTL